MTNFIALHKQQGGQAFRDLLNRPLGNMLTVLALAFSLALPTTLFMLVKNVMMMAEAWRVQNQLTVYMNQDASDSAIDSFYNKLSQWEGIDSAAFISPDEGLTQLKQIQGLDEAISLLDSNPLPSVIVVTATNDDVVLTRVLAAKLLAESLVEEVRFDSDWLQRMVAIKSLVLTLTLVFASLMLIGVFLIIGNTLRLQVLNQKAVIQVLKLVGATDSYIIRPYLYTGVWLALAGALVAWVVTLINGLLLNTVVTKLATLYNSSFCLYGLRMDESLILLMVTGFIGLFAARLAVSKYLREIEPI
ncbi:permease-like cell division protein FtsX [Candidatus Enterovibrio altilux]|nr:permease-like cell division protein FtsX [Candidatus Enterovibrio luxaltus]